MEFLELCKKRYSVRDFSSVKVEEEKLSKILEAGRLSPTAKNSQSHRIFVLKSDAALEKIRRGLLWRIMPLWFFLCATIPGKAIKIRRIPSV